MKTKKILELVAAAFENVVRDYDDINVALENDFSYEVENSIIATLLESLSGLDISQDNLRDIFQYSWSEYAVVAETLNGPDMISQSIVAYEGTSNETLHKILEANQGILENGWGWPLRFSSNPNCDIDVLIRCGEAFIENGDTEFLGALLEHPNMSNSVSLKFREYLD